MESTDLVTLERVAIRELASHVHRFSEPGAGEQFSACGLAGDEAEAELRALERLEELGLVAFWEREQASRAITLTPAGVEALAYLVSTV